MWSGPSVCTRCGKYATKKCSKCKSVWYCSAACQRDNWPEHKQSCQASGEAPSPADNAREKLKADQAEKLKAKDTVTELVATLMSTPNDPAVHVQLAFNYWKLMRPADAVEAMSKAVGILIGSDSEKATGSVTPPTELEQLVLRQGPDLVQKALIGRGEADWLAETALARQLVVLAEHRAELLPNGSPVNTRCTALRALAAALRRRGQHSEAAQQLRMADEAAAPGHDVVAIRELADELMAVAHRTSDTLERATSVTASVSAARRALEATPTADDAGKAESSLLLARVLYESLVIDLASPPKGLVSVSDGTIDAAARRFESVLPGMLASDPASEKLQLAPDDPTATEAYALADMVLASPGSHRTMRDLADMIRYRLSGAGLKSSAV